MIDFTAILMILSSFEEYMIWRINGIFVSSRRDKKIAKYEGTSMARIFGAHQVSSTALSEWKKFARAPFFAHAKKTWLITSHVRKMDAHVRESSHKMLTRHRFAHDSSQLFCSAYLTKVNRYDTTIASHSMSPKYSLAV